MPCHEVDILDPRGRYPNRSVICDSLAYLVHDGIPLLIWPLPSCPEAWREHNRHEEMLYGSFLLVRKGFPCFNFRAHPTAHIHFRDTYAPDINAAIQKLRPVIEGKLDLPCIYDPFLGNMVHTDPKKYIADLRARDAYVDLFHAPQVPLLDLLAQYRAAYEFNDRSIKPQFVQAMFKKLMSSSRHVHIAIHYFVNASRLVYERFVEDAGLNLNLVLEAVIEDFSRLNSIPDKRGAIEALRDEVQLPHEHMEFLIELYEARNEFLAHIDDNMFTDMQSIGDPDAYCYDHFESIAWLIRRYMRYREDAHSPAP